jgi:phosphate transport system ATP-binding protein
MVNGIRAKDTEVELEETSKPFGDRPGIKLSSDVVTRKGGDGTESAGVIMQLNDLTIRYGTFAAVKNVTLPIFENRVTAIIGPSGCGKSTLLRQLNRMNEFIEGVNFDGELFYRGININSPQVDPVELRQKVGMVFQKPNPFPKTISENIAWAPRLNGLVKRKDVPELVESSLRRANLWDEVKEHLNRSGLGLSGGQQQRLCIARTIAMRPEVILMDEPCSALDPKSTAAIEDLIFELREDYTIVIVTHNMQQAARVSDYTAFLVNGVLVEYGETEQVFTRPKKKQTEEYVTGRFG